MQDDLNLNIDYLDAEICYGFDWPSKCLIAEVNTVYNYAYYNLENDVQHTLPGGRLSKLAPVSVDAVPVMLTTTSVEVNLAKVQPTLSLPDVAKDVEDNDNGEGQVGLEERLGITDGAVQVGDGSVELGNQNDDVESQANV